MSPKRRSPVSAGLHFAASVANQSAPSRATAGVLIRHPGLSTVEEKEVYKLASSHPGRELPPTDGPIIAVSGDVVNTPLWLGFVKYIIRKTEVRAFLWRPYFNRLQGVASARNWHAYTKIWHAAYNPLRPEGIYASHAISL